MTHPRPRGPAAALPLRPAVFLDRDGTLVDDPGFLRNPAAVRLLPGAAAAVARLNAAGRLVVVVTNQSGIAQGFIMPEEYAAVERQVDALVRGAGGWIDATYHCPHYPMTDGPCECRKPGTLLYKRAAADHGVDLQGSWGVGDRVSDLAPVVALGGRGILVRTGKGGENAQAAAEAGFPVADDLAAAVREILGG
jgi:D-glycero-D-manno-heptose 1,7-bisphosphate phosphatase